MRTHGSADLSRLCVSAVFLLVTQLVALRSSQGPVKPDASTATKPAPTRTSETPFVIEQKHTAVRFETDGTDRRELTLKVRVLTDEGVRNWALIPLTYGPESENLELKALKVRKPDGSVVPVAADGVPDVAVQPVPQLPIFVDLRQKQVNVPALQPGDTVEVSATWTTTKPLVPGHFWFAHSFMRDAIVEDERLEIDVPGDSMHWLKDREDAPREAQNGQGTRIGTRRVYLWRASNAKLPDEKRVPTDDELVEDVRLTTFKAWEDLGRWFNPLLNVPPDAAVRAKAAELTKGISDRRQKIQVVYDYVATRVRYVSLSFGLGRLVPHAPADVLRNAYGDCKDKHALLAALLASLNIDAYPLLINSSRDISVEFASPGEIDHAFTVVPTGEDAAAWLFLDTTAEVAPFGVLVPTLRGKHAIVAGNADFRSRLVTTPADPPFPMADRLELDAKVDAIGVLKGRGRLILRGDSELVTRAVVRGLPAESLREWVQQILGGLKLAGEISNVSTGDPASTRDPFEIRFDLRRSYLSWAVPVSQLTPPSMTMLQMDVDEVPTKDTKRGTPTRSEYRATIDFPEEYALEAPVGISLSRGGAAYQSTYHIAGRRLVVERSVQFIERTLKTTSWPELVSLKQAIDRDLAQQLTVRRTGTTVPAPPDDATAAELYAAGYSAYEAKLYEPALVFWRKATSVDPEMPDAWNGVAFAHLRLGQHADAVAALEKQIALNAHDKRAHGDLGYVHRESGNLEASAKAYARHIELNPLDGDAMRRLGEAYNELDKHPEAIVALEKAIALGAKDASAYGMLGESYLSQRQADKAAAAFDRALELSDTVATWSTVAWSLAAYGAQPDRALELSSRTIAHVGAALEDLTLESVTKSHEDLMKRLAWAWQTRALVHLNRGQTEQAIRFSASAWQLTGWSSFADRLAQAYERAERRADALTYYLTAYALESSPSDDLRARLRRAGGGENVPELLAAARAELAKQRSFFFPALVLSGNAEYLALVQPGRQIAQLKRTNGSEALEPLENQLRQAVFTFDPPDDTPVRLLVRIRAECHTGQGCVATIIRP